MSRAPPPAARARTDVGREAGPWPGRVPGGGAGVGTVRPRRFPVPEVPPVRQLTTPARLAELAMTVLVARGVGGLHERRATTEGRPKPSVSAGQHGEAAARPERGKGGAGGGHGAAPASATRRRPAGRRGAARPSGRPGAGAGRAVGRRPRSPAAARPAKPLAGGAPTPTPPRPHASAPRAAAGTAAPAGPVVAAGAAGPAVHDAGGRHPQQRAAPATRLAMRAGADASPQVGTGSGGLGLP